MKRLIILILAMSLSFTQVLAEACPASGQVFKNGKCQCADGYKVSMNRCIKTQEQLATENRANQCAQAEDPQQCYADMAEEDVAGNRRDDGNDYDISKFGGFGQAMIHAAMLGISAYVIDFWVARGKGKYSCNPPSMYLMSAGATALLATEVIAYMNYGKKVRERQEAVARFVQPSTEDDETSENDVQRDYTLMAYDSIILQEKAYLAANKTRRTGHAIAMGLFGAAAASAGVEMVMLNMAKAKATTNPDTYLEKQRKLICKRYSGDDAKKIRSERLAGKSPKSGGGALSSMLPMLLMPAIGKIMGDTYQKSDEYYVNIENHFNGDFQNLSNDIQSKLINIKNAENFKELEVAMEEREMLASGNISSPSLRDYESQGFLQEVMFEKEQIEAMKTGIMIKESLRDQLDFISLFFTDELKSNQAQTKVSSL